MFRKPFETIQVTNIAVQIQRKIIIENEKSIVCLKSGFIQSRNSN